MVFSLNRMIYNEIAFILRNTIIVELARKNSEIGN